jgi:hypothetical protein
MNTRQLDYLIDETLLVLGELERDTEAWVHADNVHSMLSYLRAKLDVLLYSDYIPEELR